MVCFEQRRGAAASPHSITVMQGLQGSVGSRCRQPAYQPACHRQLSGWLESLALSCALQSSSAIAIMFTGSAATSLLPSQFTCSRWSSVLLASLSTRCMLQTAQVELQDVCVALLDAPLLLAATLSSSLCPRPVQRESHSPPLAPPRLPIHPEGAVWVAAQHAHAPGWVSAAPIRSLTAQLLPNPNRGSTEVRACATAAHAYLHL